MTIREGQPRDVRIIHSLINQGVQEGHLVERSKHDIRKNIHDFVVDDTPQGITGCASFTPYTPRIGEVRSLYVHPLHRGEGIAGRLIEAATEKAQDRVKLVFAVTENIMLFERSGYKPVEVDGLEKGMVVKKA